MIALHISALVLMVYAIASLILPLKLKWPIKVLLALGVIVLGLKYLIYSRTGGILEPKLESRLIVMLEAMYSTLLLAVVMALGKDLVLLLLWLARLLGLNLKLKVAANKFASVVAVCSLSLGVLGTLSQFKVPDVYDEAVYIKDLPASLEGYQIVQLTDLHIGPVLKREFLQGVVDRTNSLKADLVVITGDLVDGSVAKLKDEFTPFKDLKARHGVLAVTGNHEYYSGANSWIKTWEALGLTFLENESVLLQSKDAALRVAGVPDRRGMKVGAKEPNISRAYSTIINYEKGMSTAIEAPNAISRDNLERMQTLDVNAKGVVGSKIGSEDNYNAAVTFKVTSSDKRARAWRNAKTTILLAHNPAIVKEGNLGADLVLTGHTHGGTMFFLKPLIAYFNEGFVSGMYQLSERTQLYVSNGTGIWSGFSCRILVPAQIVRFTLHKK